MAVKKGTAPVKELVPDAASPLDAAIAKVVAAVQKQLGADALMKLSGPGAYPEIKFVVSTGLPSLDAVFGGCGGLPLGKLIEIFGPESVGKTSLCKVLAARCQLVAVLPATADTEQSGVLAYDQGLGLDPTRAAGGQPSTIEEVFDLIAATVDAMEAAKVLGMVFWDSVAATPMAAELELGFDEEGRMAARAGYLARNLPKLMARLKSGRVGLVFVNQVREKIGAGPYQKQTYSPGGRALRHWAHCRLEMSHAGVLKVGERQVGIKTRIKCVKNKIGIPGRETILEIRVDPPPPRLVELGAETPTRTPYNIGRRK